MTNRIQMKAALLAVALVLGGLPALASAQESPELAAAAEAYTSGNWESAVTKYYQVLESAGYEDDRQKAEYFVGSCFYKLRLYQSALGYWSQILKTGPKHRYYAKAAEGLVDIAEAINDDLIISSLLNKEYSDAFGKMNPEYLHKVNFIIGEVSYRAGRLEEAKSFLDEAGAVPKDCAYYGRAQYLLGVIDGIDRKGGNPERAIKHFEKVRALKDQGVVHYTDLDELKELATLSLARVHYGLGHYSTAVELFDSIPRFSTYWDQALFENGWARFQNDDPGGALGSLEALHAPQFAGSFQPESWILKATIYHYACLYEEVNKTLASFDSIYKPMAEKLVSLTKGEKDFVYYFKLLSTEEIPKPVKNLLFSNKRLRGFLTYIRQLDAEKARLEDTRAFRDTRLLQDLITVIDQQRNVLVSVAGKFVKNRLDDAAKQVEGFDATAEIIRLENSSREKESLEAQIDRPTVLRKLKLYRPTIPGSTYEYWRHDGEFWIDEIGYYNYTLKKPAECKEGRLEKAAAEKTDLKVER